MNDNIASSKCVERNVTVLVEAFCMYVFYKQLLVVHMKLLLVHVQHKQSSDNIRLKEIHAARFYFLLPAD